MGTTVKHVMKMAARFIRYTNTAKTTQEDSRSLYSRNNNYQTLIFTIKCTANCCTKIIDTKQQNTLYSAASSSLYESQINSLHPGIPGLILVQSMYDLWWRKWYWG